MARAELEAALRDGSSPARVRDLLAAELARSAEELRKPRPGRDEAVTVAIAPGIVAVAPVPASTRADVEGDRLAAVLLAALREAGDGTVEAGEHDGWLALRVDGDAELAVLAFDDAIARVDRLRAAALLVGDIEVADLRPLPAATSDDGVRPHDDPDPARRVARRILQTLDRKGKWGGYHTDFTHLQRGFEGNDRRLASAVGEALLAAGLLAEKPSVGQRHVFLNSRRAGDIHRLIDTGEPPDDLTLPFI